VDEKDRILKDIIACLVEQLGGEARILFDDLEDPPAIIERQDLVTGELVYMVDE
jgi:hypothetical protein